MTASNATWTLGRACLAILLLGLAASACNEGLSGASLPDHSFPFPVGVKVHPQGFALVVSANFDLRYESGAMQIIDLNVLSDTLLQGGDTSDPYNTKAILDQQAVGLDSFGSLVGLSADGTLAAVTVRERNQLVVVDVKTGLDTNGRPTLSLSCWPGDLRPAGKFPPCDGARSLVSTGGVDIFDLLLLDAPAVDGQPAWTAYVNYLRSSGIVAIEIPPRSDANDTPRVLYTLDTGNPGTNELALSPATGLVYVTSRNAATETNPVYYFDPAQGSSASINRMDLFSMFLGSEIRGLAFGADGTTLAMAVRSPDILAFLDTTPDLDGTPANRYLGSEVTGVHPSRVLRHGDLLYVTCTEDDGIYVVDGRTHRLVAKRENICRGPYDLDFYQPAGQQWAVVSCFEDGNVAVVDVDPQSPKFLDVLAHVGEPLNEE